MPPSPIPTDHSSATSQKAPFYGANEQREESGNVGGGDKIRKRTIHGSTSTEMSNLGQDKNNLYPIRRNQYAKFSGHFKLKLEMPMSAYDTVVLSSHVKRNFDN
jgi:hypothetical protein